MIGNKSVSLGGFSISCIRAAKGDIMNRLDDGHRLDVTHLMNFEARMELIQRIFTENTGLPVASFSEAAGGIYRITTDEKVFEVEAIWDPGSKPHITYQCISDDTFIWKGNKQTVARVEIDPGLLEYPAI